MKLRDKINQKQYEEKLRAFLHSYLKWLYIQNHHFAEVLTNEEIYNYLIKDVKHPDWFYKYMSSETLQKSANIYELLVDFKNDAIMFDYTVQIKPKKIGAYHTIKTEEEMEDDLICF